MGFPAVQASATYNFSSTSSLSITLPSGITAGDLLLIFYAEKDGRWQSGNVPSGFTFFGNVAAGTTNAVVFWKLGTGSEGATAAMTLSGGSTSGGTVALRISGWNGAGLEGATSATLNPPNLTPTWGATDTLWLAFLGITYSSKPTVTFPTNYTSNNVSDPNAYTNVGWFANNAASENPATFATSGGGGVATGAITLAVRPLPINYVNLERDIRGLGRGLQVGSIH